MRTVSVLSGVAVVVWFTFATTSAATVYGRPVGATEAALAKHWNNHDEQGRKHGKGHGDEDRDNRRIAVRHFFPPEDVRVIRQYYEPQYRTLPPGLQKKLYRTGRLPPGWEKKVRPIPVVVDRQLVVLPRGYQRGYLDGYAVVYNPGTHIIIDLAPLFGR